MEEENELLDDEEFTDDDVVELFRELMKKDAGNVYLNIPLELSKVSIAEDIINYCVSGEDVTVETEFNTPFITAAGIVIEGKRITINNPRVFIKLLNYCDNIEFYAKTDGSVNIGLTFSKIAEIIGGNHNE